jgi:hypothetical protein
VFYLLKNLYKLKPSQDEIMISVNSEDQAATLALALRLIDPQVFQSQPATEDVQLLVGRVPENLPVQLDFPEGSQVLGSMVDPHFVHVLFDIAEIPEQVFSFYAERLLPIGWHQWEYPTASGGFQSEHFINQRVFCQSSKGPGLTVIARRMQNQATEVRLRLELRTRNSLCKVRNPSHHRREPLPELLPPPDSYQQFQGGTAGADGGSSQATLKTGLTLSDVAAHYCTQLEKAGWHCLEQGEANPLAWSSWAFQDEDKENWQGLFFVLKTPERGTAYQYYLDLRATSVD